MNTFAIVGPTSTGKTSLALDLCKKFNGEIISADSRQIYKNMDVGTGKLPKGGFTSVEKGNGFWILDNIKIWGYDLVLPDQYFSSFDYAKYALEKSVEILSRGKTVFLTGGTGFYVDAVTGKIELNSNVSPDFILRSKLQKMSLEELQKLLTSLNLEAFEKIDKNNPVRLVRAIEKEKSKKNITTPLPCLKNPFIYIGLTGPREILYSRSDRWVASIWNNGLVSETQKLLQMGYGACPPLRGLVYKTALAYLRKELTENKAIERTKYNVHAYIRRQQTWFKRNVGIEWFDVSVDSYKENVYNHARRMIT